LLSQPSSIKFEIKNKMKKQSGGPAAIPHLVRKLADGRKWGTGIKTAWKDRFTFGWAKH